MRIGYLGPSGTFSEEAAWKWLGRGKKAELVPFCFIPDVLDAVGNRAVDYGVVPVENSIEGTVGLTLDAVTKNAGVHVAGEVVLSIAQDLAVRPGGPEQPERVERVHSHPQALSQCREFLRQKMPGAQVFETSSTAEAAAIVASGSANGEAAICSAFAAEKYGLRVLVSDIQDYPNNKTRFFIAAPGGAVPHEYTGNEKTSLAFALPEDRPGSLYQVLKRFADAGINLTKIESRPAKQELGQYIFYLDCEACAWDGELQALIEALGPQTAFLKILGSYPRGG